MYRALHCRSRLSSASKGLASGCLRSDRSCMSSWLALCWRSWLQSLGCSCLESSHISSSPWPSVPGKGHRAPSLTGNSSRAAACQARALRMGLVPGADEPGREGTCHLCVCRWMELDTGRDQPKHRKVTVGTELFRKATTSVFQKPGEGSSVSGWDLAACVHAAQAGVMLSFQPRDSRSYLSQCKRPHGTCHRGWLRGPGCCR